MTRGNQREQDRLKSQKKLAAANKGKKMSGTNLQKRKEADADAIRRKQELKEEKKEDPGRPKGADGDALGNNQKGKGADKSAASGGGGNNRSVKLP